MKMRSRSGWLIPLLVVVGAFVVRLVFLLQTRGLAPYYNPGLDSQFFLEWVAYKRGMGWLDAAMPFREPLYAFFLALLYSIRESLVMVRVVQAALGALTVWMVYGLARHLFGRAAAAGAAVIMALYGSAVFFSAEINEVTLATFLLVASAYLLVRAAEARPVVGSLVSGILLGAAFLARFTTVAALPAWLIHLAASGRRRLQQGTLLLVIGFVVVPVCYHVFLARADEHAMLPLRSGWHAFLGSAETGGSAHQPYFDISLSSEDGAYDAIAVTGGTAGQKDALRYASIERESAVSGVQAANHWRQKAAEGFFSDPARHLALYFRKLGLFFGPSEPPANLDMRFMARYSRLAYLPPFVWAVVAPMGLVGFFLVRRRGGIGPAILVPLFACLVSVYLISDLDKALMVPFLALFAGGVIERVARGLTGGRPGRAAAVIVVTAVIGAVLYLLPARPMAEAPNLVAIGNVYADVKIFDHAESNYREAIEVSPDRPEAYVALARLYRGMNRSEDGLAVLDRALDRGLDDPRLRIEKASILLVAGKPARALEQLQPVEEEYPYQGRLHQLMGMSLMAMDRVDEAAEHLEREARYGEAGFITYTELGRAKLAQGAYGEAADYLEAALSLNPYNSTAALRLADAYTRIGQHLRACDVLSRVLSVDPGNMPMRFKLANCLYRAERYEDALQRFQELAKFDPANSDIFLNLGTVYAAMDSLDLAIEMWEKALRLDPSNEIARENLRTAKE
jgi:tetratricopeptide (TPR) repeat protein